MKVYLIGAGPGDIGLLTLKAQSILAKADVVVYDFLASNALLKMARPDAELIDVGKIANKHTMPQDQINQLLVDKAQENKIVARLKGGDPYIFGRGGEEAEFLLAHGVAFEEVPGISSTIAAPAYAGIPLTHRSYASSVTIITGHEDADKTQSVHNWQALAQSASTLVFVMGMKNLANICSELIQAGLASSTPAALVHWGTSSKQRSLCSDLANIEKEAKLQGFTNPSVIVVGNVVKLSPKLNWFEARPLHGKTVVVTRAREQASSIVASLEDLGAQVIEFPTIEIKAITDYSQIDSSLNNLNSYDYLIFTSVNGIKYFFARLNALAKDSRSLAQLKIAVIGQACAEELKKYGIQADIIPPRFIAESLAEELSKENLHNKKILLARAKDARDILLSELTKSGAKVDILPIYETVLANTNQAQLLLELEAHKVHCLSFASSSTVDNFFKLIDPKLIPANTKIAAIGPITAQTVTKYGFKVDIQPESYMIDDLVESIRLALI